MLGIKPEKDWLDSKEYCRCEELEKKINKLEPRYDALADGCDQKRKKIQELEREVEQLKGLVFKHHDVGKMINALDNWGKDCEICKEHKQALKGGK